MIYQKTNKIYEEENYKHYIYKITNLTNNKVYIGQTVNPKKRFKNHILSLKKNEHHSEHFQNAFNKYGSDYFVFEVVDFADSLDDINEKEKLYIYLYNSADRDFGYNIEEGGKNSIPTENTRKKLSKNHANVSGKNNPNYGKKSWNNGKTSKNDSRILSGKKHPMYGIKGKNHPSFRRKANKEERKLRSDIKNSSGIFKTTGASFRKYKNPEKRCWISQIRYKGSSKSLGMYEDPFTAEIVYKLVKEEIYR